jgi:hypothetical protein
MLRTFSEGRKRIVLATGAIALSVLTVVCAARHVSSKASRDDGVQKRLTDLEREKKGALWRAREEAKREHGPGDFPVHLPEQR